MNAEPDENLVEPQHACPLCGERRADCLVWKDDQTVECQMCGIEYTPGT